MVIGRKFHLELIWIGGSLTGYMGFADSQGREAEQVESEKVWNFPPLPYRNSGGAGWLENRPGPSTDARLALVWRLRGQETAACRSTGNPLSISYQNRWSVQTIPLHEVPALLRNAFIESEDRSFASHGGVDWPARVHALAQNLRAMRAVRGASTISEQVVRMIHPRPRTVWSRWLEGIEAARLEKRFSKSAILEFYLNQVPYGHQRRGVVEASRFYFDRDPTTLNAKESLALAVLVRAPSGLDPKQRKRSLSKTHFEARSTYARKGLLSETEYRAALVGRF